MPANKNIILDVSVIIDLWIGENSSADTESLINEALAGGVSLWVSASSLAALDYVGKQVLKRKGYPENKIPALVAGLMENLLSFAGVLTCHGFEQPEIYGKALDFEDAQIAAAGRSLAGAQICVVTEDNSFDNLGEIPAFSPSRALDWMRGELEDQNSSMPFIDLSSQQHLLRPAIEGNIERVLRHGKYIMGPEVRELETRLAEFVGAGHCITCSSGTDALLMALMALDIGQGHEVITVPYTWISTAEVIALLGAKPVFVDIEPDTFNMDPEKIEAAITSATRAIMPVGIYGQCADMTRINAIAEKHDIAVIEDAAQSFGATHRGRNSCGLSTIGCTSFFPSKPLGCYGDGGAIFTIDDALADKLRQIRVHGQKVKHQHPLVGINGRLDTIQAAILLEKLAVFPDECKRRNRIARSYDELLADIPGVRPPVIGEANTSVYAQYTILSENREKLSAALKTKKIPSVAYYTAPLHLQGAFADLAHGTGDFPVTEKIAAQCLSLPMSPYLTRADQENVAKALRDNP